jgi:hypothetical protein
MDPGTALAIVGLVLDGVKEVYEYYTTWKYRDEDVADVRGALLWLKGLFGPIKIMLTNDSLDKTQVRMICDSVQACEDYAANRSLNRAPLTLRTHLWGPIGRVRVLYFSKDPPTRDPMGRQGPSGSYGSFIGS